MLDLNFIFKKNITSILLLIVILVFSFISFSEFTYNEGPILTSRDKPNFFYFSLAIILLSCFVSRYLPHSKLYSIERRKYSYTVNIDENHTIIIKQGDISCYDGGVNKAILLPANTSFDEKCINDTNSALGSYFQKKFPGKINYTKKAIIDEATRKFYLSDDKKCAEPGDTIVLPNYDGEKINILISAVTKDYPSIGIQADAMGIINSIKNAISICSEHRYSSITMPIIGTGHGGIEPKISLILICIQYFLSVYHLQNHHVKELEIVVFDQKKQLRNDIDETVGCIKKLILKKKK